ncbi:unnamed protein product [Meloidogyne enterolobii]|uniref:Uncharacterized protein n=1 Tax=Meloidogyne enterolobii TaxID=390850 RepID=A0ACB0YAI1_MELEN
MPFIIKIEKNVEDLNLDLDIKRRKFELENNGFASLLSSNKIEIIWGIINLGYPPQNVAYKINYYTQIIIKEKMEIAIEQLNEIEKLENENKIKEKLSEWIKGENFVEMYQHYLLVICAYSPDSLGGPSLCDVIESHLTFLLIKKFETLKFIEYFHINPKALFKRENCPKATGIKEEDWKCTGWIIGFKILKEEEIKENIEELKNKIKSLKENDFKKYIDKNGEEGKIKIGASYLNKKKFKEFIAV